MQRRVSPSTTMEGEPGQRACGADPRSSIFFEAFRLRRDVVDLDDDAQHIGTPSLARPPDARDSPGGTGTRFVVNGWGAELGSSQQTLSATDAAHRSRVRLGGLGMVCTRVALETVW